MDIFSLDNMDEDELNEKINIDELYEKKRLGDLTKLTMFKKQLAQVHKRIKSASNQKTDNVSCWFVVPEHIIGVSKFDNPGCIAYLMDNLEKNKFMVKYYHPNAIYISWNHWMPAYIRDEIKKRYGIIVDEFGQQVVDKDDENEDELHQPMSDPKKIPSSSLRKDGKTYTPIDSYRQMGNIAYKQGVKANTDMNSSNFETHNEYSSTNYNANDFNNHR